MKKNETEGMRIYTELYEMSISKLKVTEKAHTDILTEVTVN